jgi:hypothetical protein
MTQIKLRTTDDEDDLAYYQQLIEDHLNTVKHNMMTSGARDLESNEFRVSSIGYPQCWLWYEKHRPEWKQAEKIDTDNIASNVIPGTAGHEAFQKWDPPHAVPEETTVVFDNGKIQLSGHIDQDTLHPNMLCDYKFIKSLYYARKKGRASDHYIHQINTYAILAKKKVFGVAHLSKLDYKHYVYVQWADKLMFAEDIARLERILYDYQKCPPLDKEAFFCKFCPFRVHCEVK